MVNLSQLSTFLYKWYSLVKLNGKIKDNVVEPNNWDKHDFMIMMIRSFKCNLFLCFGISMICKEAQIYKACKPSLHPTYHSGLWMATNQQFGLFFTWHLKIKLIILGYYSLFGVLPVFPITKVIFVCFFICHDFFLSLFFYFLANHCYAHSSCFPKSVNHWEEKQWKSPSISFHFWFIWL